MAVPNRPRLVDVAERAGVAVSTASRALSGSASISEPTRERVHAAADDLGYRVNLVASGLKSGQTRNIGLVAPMNYWYAGAVTAGADRLLAANDYDFVVMNVAGGTDSELMLARARRLSQRVDGALVVDIADGDLLEALVAELAAPVVTLGCSAEGLSSVLVDNLDIGAQAAEHLLKLGHTRAVVLAVRNSSPLAYDNAGERRDGFFAAFAGNASALELPYDNAGQRRDMILDAAARSTALFCASDELAIEALAVLRSAGTEVPGDVSVVGVDDHPLAQPTGLTTIRQSPGGMGERAAQLLVAELSTESSTLVERQRIVIETELIVRSSTGRAAP